MRLGCDTPASFLSLSFFSSTSPSLTQSWWDLSADKFLCSHNLSGPLSPRCFLPPPSRFFCARLTPERQQNVSARRLYVRAAVNKLNAVLTGHWEVVSANPCILVALTFTIPSYFCHLSVVIGLSSSNHKGDGYKSRGLHRSNYPFRRRVIRNNGHKLQCMTNRADLLTLFWYSGVIFKDQLRLTVGQVWGEEIKMWH